MNGLEIKKVPFMGTELMAARDNDGQIMKPEADYSDELVDRNNGLFEVKECFNKKTPWSGIQMMITPKGRETFWLLCQCP